MDDDKAKIALAEIAMKAHDASLAENEETRAIGLAYKAFGEAMTTYLGSSLKANDVDEFMERVIGPAALCGRLLGGLIGIVGRDGHATGVNLLVATFRAHAETAAKDAAHEIKQLQGATGGR